VLGVFLDWECSRETYRVEPGPRFFASGYPRPLPGVPPRKNLYGISFAVANFTGIAARDGMLNLDENVPFRLDRNIP